MGIIFLRGWNKMDWIQVLAAVLTIFGTVGTIIGSMYGMLKFMLKDVHKEVEILKENQKEFKEEIRHTNNRLDGLYRVILDRTYGKNIPEELK